MRLTDGWARPEPFGPPARFALICASILLGSFSHISWDAFTHQGGLFVTHWSGFRRPLGPGGIPVYRWLQYGSSLFGMTALGVWAHQAGQRPVAPAIAPPADSSSLSRARLSMAGAILGGTFLVGVIGAIQGASGGDPWDVAKGGGVGALAGASAALLLSSAGSLFWAHQSERRGHFAAVDGSSGPKFEVREPS